jgi:hypothetical protein
MPTKVTAQADYLLTELSIERTSDLNELDAIIKSTKSTGKVTIVYNNGGRIGINIEQKTKATEGDSVKVRDILGIETKLL